MGCNISSGEGGGDGGDGVWSGTLKLVPRRRQTLTLEVSGPNKGWGVSWSWADGPLEWHSCGIRLLSRDGMWVLPSN